MDNDFDERLYTDIFERFKRFLTSASRGMIELRRKQRYEERLKNRKTRHYKVITLCGSTRFKDAFMREQKRLTLEGNIVISVGLFGHSGDDEVWADDGQVKVMLDDIHMQKIDMSDGIFVINEGGYIGESTKREIEYAMINDKTVEFMCPIPARGRIGSCMTNKE